MHERNPEPNGRLLARIVRELLRAETFESLADLTDAVKFRCARLRIRWTNDEIADAFRLIATNTELAARPRPFVGKWNCRRIGGYEPAPDISRVEAAAILARLGVRL